MGQGDADAERVARDHAYHQAGLAVARYLRGGHVDGVSLGASPPDQRPWAALLERFRPGEDPAIPAQGRWLRTAALTCLAGEAAVSLAADARMWRADSPEVPRARALAEEHSHGRTDDAQVSVRLMWRECRRWLGKPRNWALVEAVAGALVRKRALDAARFRAIVEDARHRAWRASRSGTPGADRAGNRHAAVAAEVTGDLSV